jgi:hypothetical protein
MEGWPFAHGGVAVRARWPPGLGVAVRARWAVGRWSWAPLAGVAVRARWPPGLGVAVRARWPPGLGVAVRARSLSRTTTAVGVIRRIWRRFGGLAALAGGGRSRMLAVRAGGGRLRTMAVRAGGGRLRTMEVSRPLPQAGSVGGRSRTLAARAGGGRLRTMGSGVAVCARRGGRLRTMTIYGPVLSGVASRSALWATWCSGSVR